MSRAIEVQDGIIVTLRDEISEWRNPNGGREIVTVYTIWERVGDTYNLLGRKRMRVNGGKLGQARYIAEGLINDKRRMRNG